MRITKPWATDQQTPAQFQMRSLSNDMQSMLLCPVVKQALLRGAANSHGAESPVSSKNATKALKRLGSGTVGAEMRDILYLVQQTALLYTLNATSKGSGDQVKPEKWGCGTRAEDNRRQGSAGVAGAPQKPGWKQESRGLFHTFKWGLVGGAGHTAST